MKAALPFGENALLPIELTTAASTWYGGVQKSIHGNGLRTIKGKDVMLIISSKEIKFIMKTINFFKNVVYWSKTSLKQLKFKQNIKIVDFFEGY